MHSLQKSQGQGYAFQFSQESFQKELLNQNPPKRPTMAQGLGGKKAQQHYTSSRQGKPSKANHKHQLLPVPRENLHGNSTKNTSYKKP
jgi:hypothetical protein